jgi:transcriptional regulator of arginine metabolism
MKKINKENSLIDALKLLLTSREASSQENICEVLEKQGFEVNQSKISRLLRKVGAIKVVNPKGQIVYSLPKEPAPPAMGTTLRSLILNVIANEAMVVIMTSPGSASMVARVLDHAQLSYEILGTIAGDDTIFVAPKTIKHTQKLAEEIRKLLLS